MLCRAALCCAVLCYARCDFLCNVEYLAVSTMFFFEMGQERLTG